MKSRKWLRWFMSGAVIVLLLTSIGIGGWFWVDYQKRLTFKPEGQIAYECWPDGASRICVINADGTGYKQLTSFSNTIAYRPSWSPDGKRLIYEANSNMSVNAVRAIFVVSMNGTDPNLKQITDNQCESVTPSWSSSGEYIAFAKYDNNKNCKGITGIYVMRSDGSNQKRLINYGDMPAWSPDGSKIAYVYNNNIYVMNSDGANSIQVSNIISDLPIWSPDGKQIVFACVLNNKGGICRIDDQGNNLQMIVQSGFYSYNWNSSKISWSPDGEYIVYSTKNPFCLLCNLTGLLWITKADGSYQSQLTYGSISMAPAWRPVK